MQVYLSIFASSPEERNLDETNNMAAEGSFGIEHDRRDYEVFLLLISRIPSQGSLFFCARFMRMTEDEMCCQEVVAEVILCSDQALVR